MTASPCTVLPVQPDTYLTTVEVNAIDRPEPVGQVLALRLGRRSVDDVEALLDGGRWWTVGKRLRLRVEHASVLAEPRPPARQLAGGADAGRHTPCRPGGPRVSATAWICARSVVATPRGSTRMSRL